MQPDGTQEKNDFAGGMMGKDLFENLFIFEMANNHMGDVEHGMRIINEVAEAARRYPFTYAVKFQYRDLDTFIHPQYKSRMDIKYVKRFMETRIPEKDQRRLRDEVKQLGLMAVCTPFDEPSVDLIEKHEYDVIKIASCSFTDWPLLERIAETGKPIIASTAGASLDDIDKVVLFLEHRKKKFCIMHCIGEYPTQDENLQLNQIDLLRQRYPAVMVGYSTHEAPDNTDAIQMAIAKGATVFERHVAVETGQYGINAYSSTPEQISRWLASAHRAFRMCGVSGKRFEGTAKERRDLRGLQRGVFAKSPLRKGMKVDSSNTFFAIPNLEKQLVANEMSKYAEYIAEKDLEVNQPVFREDMQTTDLRGKVLHVIRQVRDILMVSRVALPDKLEMELSHHYGIDRFEECGATIINCINREYCKKLIVLLPGQKHPVHYHRKKEETFHVLYGDLTVNLAGEVRDCKTGDMIIVERGTRHDFCSHGGAIFEEISTTHYRDDSYYADESILGNKCRKTALTFWSDWLCAADLN
jgi:sialic acid synthase SpsE/mannose-6-phosphate isomerase-like protein (cupin superfamily)